MDFLYVRSSLCRISSHVHTHPHAPPQPPPPLNGEPSFSEYTQPISMSPCCRIKEKSPMPYALNCTAREEESYPAWTVEGSSHMVVACYAFRWPVRLALHPLGVCYCSSKECVCPMSDSKRLQPVKILPRCNPSKTRTVLDFF